MNIKTNSLIIGKGQGISKYLSNKIGIKCISSSEISKLDFSKYQNIIYTSTDPSYIINSQNIYKYIEKNFRNIFYILESNFRGKITYLSSVESGSFEIKRIRSDYQVEEMYTPYSFSKFTMESLLLNHRSFMACNILRLGLLWPAKLNSNIHSVINCCSDNLNLNVNVNSRYFITPYSLVLNFLKENIFNQKNENIFGYLMSSNSLTLKSIFELRGIEYNKFDNNYLYLAKEKDIKLPNLADGGWFDWEKENDYERLIAKALQIGGSEALLPNRS